MMMDETLLVEQLEAIRRSIDELRAYVGPPDAVVRVPVAAGGDQDVEAPGGKVRGIRVQGSDGSSSAIMRIRLGAGTSGPHLCDVSSDNPAFVTIWFATPEAVINVAAPGASGGAVSVHFLY